MGASSLIELGGPSNNENKIVRVLEYKRKNSFVIGFEDAIQFKKAILNIKFYQNIPTKICSVCQRPFKWRKKWRLNWEKVKYCSKRCSSK